MIVVLCLGVENNPINLRREIHPFTIILQRVKNV
jgi:hypothetical protein